MSSTTEPKNPQQNYAEHMIQEYKKSINMIMDRMGTPDEYWMYAAEYVIYLLNHLSVKKLKWKTPNWRSIWIHSRHFDPTAVFFLGKRVLLQSQRYVFSYYKRQNEHESMISLLRYNCKGTGKQFYYCCIQDIIETCRITKKK